MLKFPQINNNISDRSYIVSGNVAYAKHNKINKAYGKQIGFLTEHALMFILQGRKHFHIGEETVTVNPGEVLLVKRGIYTISEFVPRDGYFEALILFIPDKLLKSVACGPLKTANTAVLPFVIAKCDTLLTGFASQYLDYFTQNIAEKEKLLQLKLQEVFVLLSNTHAKDAVTALVASCMDMGKPDIEFIVKTHLLQQLNLADFARLSCRSLSSFKRDFEKQFHAPPRQWINRQRIAHASGLLQGTGKPVSEIALECGFENTSYFIKIFKKETGHTPASLRAKSGNN